MIIVQRCYDIDGEIEYNKSNVIGIYDDITKAKNDLQTKLKELKYEYDVECDDPEYYFVFVESINGKERHGRRLCYEITMRKMKLNEIKMKS